MPPNTNNDTKSDLQVLSLFEGANPVTTPTEGVRAWLARDASNGRKPVLIKRVDANRHKGRATEALSLLHPAIVRTRRWLIEGGSLYVVRDVVRGRNLRQVIEGNTNTTPETVRQLLLPVIDALEHAHGEGFPHGGISPENVLVGEDSNVFVSDFATADPKAPQHFRVYSGSVSVAGDVKALGRLIAEFLPRTGNFARAEVRGRVERIALTCGTLTDLKSTITMLEKLAVPPPSPAGRETSGAGTQTVPPQRPTLLSPGRRTTENISPPITSAPTGSKTTPSPNRAMARLTCVTPDRAVRVPQGGGGTTTVILKNEGQEPISVRMIATQHTWLNLRPQPLPLILPPGATSIVGFVISAARLTPGEYRSEVYLSADAPGQETEDLRGGWFKHICEVRVTVEGGYNPSRDELLPLR